MKKLLFFVILLISVVRLDAQNIGDQITIDSLIYKVTSISPAECEVYRYTDSITDITIYVPESSVESYKVATPWNYYDIIGFSPTFVSEVHNEDLNSGIYFVKIKTNNGTITKRFVKQ